ncbi:hypothetical protein LCGC14_2450890, partial [marine sediment metagenome]
MTVSSTTIKTAPFTGDGATVTFAFSWKVWDSVEIKVILRLVSDGSETTLTLTTDYSVTLGSTLPSAGSITTVETYESTHEIVIKANFPRTQEVDYGEGDTFPAASHEEALDRGVRLSQQLNEQLSRSLLFPESSIFSDIALPEPASDEFLKWNNAATALNNASLVAFADLNTHDNGASGAVHTTLMEDHNDDIGPHTAWYATNEASGPVVLATDNQATALNSQTAVLTPFSAASAFPFFDGDLLEISWAPLNYTPSAAPAEANDASDITAHLQGIDTALATVGSENFVIVWEQKTLNNNGGTFTSGAYRTRSINAASDSYNIATVASDQVTLNAGTYEVIGFAPALGVDNHQARLQNVTDNETLLWGRNSGANNLDNTLVDSVIMGQIVVGANVALELQHICQTTK